MSLERSAPPKSTDTPGVKVTDALIRGTLKSAGEVKVTYTPRESKKACENEGSRPSNR